MRNIKNILITVCAVLFTGLPVQQLIAALRQMPAQAVVLIEADAGYALVGGMDLEENGDGVPDEVILLASLEGD